MNYDLKTTAEDGAQRMLNALEVGVKVSIYRHLETPETVFLEPNNSTGYGKLWRLA